MNTAVVAPTEREARMLIARLGMVGKATPLHQGSSALLGRRFTAVLLAPGVALDWKNDWDTELTTRISLVGGTRGQIMSLTPVEGLE